MAANCDVCGKGPGFGHSISPLPPTHQASLEPQHPARARMVASPQAPERVHQLPEGRQGHSRALRSSSPACAVRGV